MSSQDVIGRASDAGSLRVENLSLSFGGLNVLTDVSLSVDAGHILGIVGPNGAGKSSLLNCAMGTYRPQTGRITIGGHEVLGRRPSQIAKLGVARTFQAVQLIRDYTVEENVLVGRHLQMNRNFFAGCLYLGPARRQERAERVRVAELLDAVGLSRRRRAKVSELSYGEQRRVEIARAMASEPALMFLDEPTSGMGHTERREVGDLLRDLNRSAGLTQVLNEHDVNFVARLCETVLVLDFGKVLAQGTPEEVFSDPQVVEAYVGL